MTSHDGNQIHENGEPAAMSSRQQSLRSFHLRQARENEERANAAEIATPFWEASHRPLASPAEYSSPIIAQTGVVTSSLRDVSGDRAPPQDHSQDQDRPSLPSLWESIWDGAPPLTDPLQQITSLHQDAERRQHVDRATQVNVLQVIEHAESSMNLDARPLQGIRTVDGSASIHYAVPSGSGIGNSKRSRDESRALESKDPPSILNRPFVKLVMTYNSTSFATDSATNDDLLHYSSAAKLPVQYTVLDGLVPSCFEDAMSAKRRPTRPSDTTSTSDNLDYESDHSSVPASVGRHGWGLPVELTEHIAKYLPRDDIKALRLVSHELNHCISQVIFRTVVVPFDTKIYGMLEPVPRLDIKGKGRTTTLGFDRYSNEAYSDGSHGGQGLDVFRGFGKYIQRFGMSFELDEEALAFPPDKVRMEKITSFWGEYWWPPKEYRRFETMAAIEVAADNTHRMKQAFSELTDVTELALSMDNGLGWLNGPDKSIRAKIMQKPSQIWRGSHELPDRRAIAQRELWENVESRHGDMAKHDSDITVTTLFKVENHNILKRLEEETVLSPEQPNAPCLDALLIKEAYSHDEDFIPVSAMTWDVESLSSLVTKPSTTSNGALYVGPIVPGDVRQLMGPVIPANLTNAQKEWLLETDWAQHAFLHSYTLSIVDNPTTFQHIHSLSIPRLPSSYLPLLDRHDFWQALPTLSSLTLLVTPAWRSMHKDKAGFVNTELVDPTISLESFCALLYNQITFRSNIRTLKIGWTTGGEHAEGLCARNKLLFPAPMWFSGIRASHSDDTYGSPIFVGQNTDVLRSCLLHFPHVERLSLANCWMTPHTLKNFVGIHDEYTLKHLELNSVSLTTVLSSTQPAGEASVNNGLVQQQAHAVALWNFFNTLQGPQTLPAPRQNQVEILQAYLGTMAAQSQQLENIAINRSHRTLVQSLQSALDNQLEALASSSDTSSSTPQTHVLSMGPVSTVSPTTLQMILNLSNQMHQLQAAVGTGRIAPANVPAPAFAPATAYAPSPAIEPMLRHLVEGMDSELHARPREGSWMNIIDIISPGNNLSNCGSEHSQADPDRETSLKSIEFISCGYAKLLHTPFPQPGFGTGYGMRRWDDRLSPQTVMALSKRAENLAKVLPDTTWPHLGRIAQCVNMHEFAVLEAVWNMKIGWADQDAARAAEFDDALPGGTGRFSGIVSHADRVVATSANE